MADNFRPQGVDPAVGLVREPDRTGLDLLVEGTRAIPQLVETRRAEAAEQDRVFEELAARATIDQRNDLRTGAENTLSELVRLRGLIAEEGNSELLDELDEYIDQQENHLRTLATPITGEGLRSGSLAEDDFQIAQTFPAVQSTLARAGTQVVEDEQQRERDWANFEMGLQRELMELEREWHHEDVDRAEAWEKFMNGLTHEQQLIVQNNQARLQDKLSQSAYNREQARVAEERDYESQVASADRFISSIQNHAAAGNEAGVRDGVEEARRMFGEDTWLFREVLSAAAASGDPVAQLEYRQQTADTESSEHQATLEQLKVDRARFDNDRAVTNAYQADVETMQSALRVAVDEGRTDDIAFWQMVRDNPGSYGDLMGEGVLDYLDTVDMDQAVSDAQLAREQNLDSRRVARELEDNELSQAEQDLELLTQKVQQGEMDLVDGWRELQDNRLGYIDNVVARLETEEDLQAELARWRNNPDDLAKLGGSWFLDQLEVTWRTNEVRQGQSEALQQAQLMLDHPRDSDSWYAGVTRLLIEGGVDDVAAREIAQRVREGEYRGNIAWELDFLSKLQPGGDLSMEDRIKLADFARDNYKATESSIRMRYGACVPAMDLADAFMTPRVPTGTGVCSTTDRANMEAEVLAATAAMYGEINKYIPAVLPQALRDTFGEWSGEGDDAVWAPSAESLQGFVWDSMPADVQQRYKDAFESIYPFDEALDADPDTRSVYGLHYDAQFAFFLAQQLGRLPVVNTPAGDMPLADVDNILLSPEGGNMPESQFNEFFGGVGQSLDVPPPAGVRDESGAIVSGNADGAAATPTAPQTPSGADPVAGPDPAAGVVQPDERGAFSIEDARAAGAMVSGALQQVEQELRDLIGVPMRITTYAGERYPPGMGALSGEPHLGYDIVFGPPSVEEGHPNWLENDGRLFPNFFNSEARVVSRLPEYDENGNRSSLGNRVIYRVGDEFVMIGHLSDEEFDSDDLYGVGRTVPPGGWLGRQGNTGSASTAPHLDVQIVYQNEDGGYSPVATRGNAFGIDEVNTRFDRLLRRS